MNDHRERFVVSVVTTRQSTGNAPNANATNASSSQTQHNAEIASENSAKSPTTNNKRNSGLFSFFKWFRSSSKESVDSDHSLNSSLGSVATAGSNSSLNSTGTAASFSFVPPAVYAHNAKLDDKCINPGPETDTYKARLKQRDRFRERDKNLTLRKKYNLFFHRDKDTSKKKKKEDDENKTKDADNCKSLPLMTKTKMETDDKGHRRTNSDSSKNKKAGAYCHVKGKRKAPAPPKGNSEENSLSLRRKKRLAPQPPSMNVSPINRTKVLTVLDTCQNGPMDIEYADVVIENDYLKLDNGVLKATKEFPPVAVKTKSKLPFGFGGGPSASPKSDIPVSPKPWYKRNSSQNKRDSRYEPVMAPLDKNDNNNCKGFKLFDDKDKDKRKSNMMFLTNISELDREASEIIKNQSKTKSATEDADLYDMPEFMRSKVPPVTTEEPEVPVGPTKRKSAKDLIAKFNAITNVTKVTVNSAIFGPNKEKNYFGRNKGVELKQYREQNKENDAYVPVPLAKCETSACILQTKAAKMSPKVQKAEKVEWDKKNWNCPKCNLENDYWRIICHVCSTIKPYFDDLGAADPPKVLKVSDRERKPSKEALNSGLSGSSSSSNNSLKEPAQPQVTNTVEVETSTKSKITKLELPVLARSRTQIAFSNFQHQQQQRSSAEEKEKLKKMLIEMKNSLPKRKSHHQLANRKSTIDETPETLTVLTVNQEIQENQQNLSKSKSKATDPNLNTPKDEKLQEIDKKIVQKEEEVKQLPVKVSSSVQTSAMPSTSNNILVQNKVVTCSNKNEGPYQLLRPKDFEDIYSEKVAGVAHVYANLASSTNENLFINVPKKLNELKQNLAAGGGPTDTLEINKLLKRLETAIAKGDLSAAAGYARELAQLKVNCSVIRQRPNLGPFTDAINSNLNGFTVEMYVEDRLSHRGPFPIQVTDKQTVLELKKQVHEEFDIPSEVQRWILGKELAGNDNATMKEHNISKGCPIFLYLVAPSSNNSKIQQLKTVVKENENEKKELNTEIKFPQSQNSKSSKLPTPVPLTSGSSGAGPSLKGGIVRSPQSAFALVAPSSPQTERSEKPETNAPKIVGEQLKVHVMIKPKSNVEVAQIVSSATTASSSTNLGIVTTTNLVTAVKTSVVVQTAPSATPSKLVKTPPKAEQDFSEYDKTLKNTQATDNWICHMCTLVNVPTTNICSVCATVRLKSDGEKAKQSKLHYYELMHLDNSDLVSNSDTFECLVCLTEVPPKGGVTLRECLHQFCKTCLSHTIEFCEEAEVKCPFRDAQYSCDIALQDREIKALVTKHVYDQFLAKSVTQAENKMDKSFHCKTPDCTGWCIFEDNVNEFRCPICKMTNCLTCQAIHVGLNCRQYQERINADSENGDDAKQTREMLNEMVAKGEALTCPACKVILMKKWGCDWVRCSMCKTEICWVTRGLRWGPGGKGDTSGGCKCGVNGVKCHAKCNYCH